MRNRESGHALAELSAVMLMGSMAVALAAALLHHGAAEGRTVAVAATHIDASTRTLRTLERDLREAVTVVGATPGILDIRSHRGDFTWTVEEGNLVRRSPEGEEVLTRGVAALEVRRSGTMAEVTVVFAPGAGGTERPPPLFTAVALRPGKEAR